MDRNCMDEFDFDRNCDGSKLLWVEMSVTMRRYTLCTWVRSVRSQWVDLNDRSVKNAITVHVYTMMVHTVYNLVDSGLSSCLSLSYPLLSYSTAGTASGSACMSSIASTFLYLYHLATTMNTNRSSIVKTAKRNRIYSM